MAKSILNVVMQGASGKIGKTLVFRQMSTGETVIANRPQPRTKPLTLGELKHRDRFLKAVHLAKVLSEDPILKPQYLAKAGPRKGAYTIALRDCLSVPQIKEIFLNDYAGTIGNVISVWAIDDFKVTSVKLRILQADDTLIEEGFASLADNAPYWTYLTTVNNTFLAGTKIEVTASDIPGNNTLEVAIIE